MFRLRRFTKYDRYIVALFLALFLVSVSVNLYHLTSTDDPNAHELWKTLNKQVSNGKGGSNSLMDAIAKDKQAPKSHNDGAKPTEKHSPDPLNADAENIADKNLEFPKLENFPKPNYNLHAFYYPWYGNPENDDKYVHWNHEYIQHWEKKVAIKWPKGSHVPPDDIGAAFYPDLGPYSSKDVTIIEEHMKQLRIAAIGVIAVSWYPPDEADSQGVPFDRIIPLLLEAAAKYQLKVCLHIEPFKNRSAAKLHHNIKYIIGKYGQHPAFYRRQHNGKALPLYYVYDSYQVSSQEWARIFSPEGDLTVRGTDLDGLFVGLLVESRHRQDILQGGFDGFYTYFASDGFTYGSKSSNWKLLAKDAKSQKLLFIPSVGPGYDDERVRPWNAVNTKDRLNGAYYENSFSAALAASPPIVTITSFNEWHEGTQIEKAVPNTISDYKYKDYLPDGVEFYLSLTRKWSFKYSKLDRN